MFFKVIWSHKWKIIIKNKEVLIISLLKDLFWFIKLQDRVDLALSNTSDQIVWDVDVVFLVFSFFSQPIPTFLLVLITWPYFKFPADKYLWDLRLALICSFSKKNPPYNRRSFVLFLGGSFFLEITRFSLKEKGVRSLTKYATFILIFVWNFRLSFAWTWRERSTLLMDLIKVTPLRRWIYCERQRKSYVDEAWSFIIQGPRL